MYDLEYLPLARKDMVEAVRYISEKLKNPIAAEQLAVELIEAGDSIRTFPYANPVHMPLRPLGHEYRQLLVHSYLVFSWVDEKKKLVTVARVIYARRHYERLLEQ